MRTPTRRHSSATAITARGAPKGSTAFTRGRSCCPRQGGPGRSTTPTLSRESRWPAKSCCPPTSMQRTRTCFPVEALLRMVRKKLDSWMHSCLKSGCRWNAWRSGHCPTPSMRTRMLVAGSRCAKSGAVEALMTIWRCPRSQLSSPRPGGASTSSSGLRTRTRPNTLRSSTIWTRSSARKRRNTSCRWRLRSSTGFSEMEQIWRSRSTSR
mmetsp:Transcript_44775/g.112878  ORF Transcript_44775/g.112878 Transcript_44775/m.112878 type:complete len:210 (-) Transcript_44775:241-870(-)